MCEKEIGPRVLVKFVIPTLIPISFSVLGTNSDYNNVNLDITRNASNTYALTSLFCSWTINLTEYASAEKHHLANLEGR